MYQPQVDESVRTRPEPIPQARPVTPAQPLQAKSPTPAPRDNKFFNVTDLFKMLISCGASDLHFQAGSSPFIRVNGELRLMNQIPPLSAAQTQQLAQALMDERQRDLFNKTNELDFAVKLGDDVRMRCNAHKQRQGVGLVMRVLKNQIPSFESLGLPGKVMEYFVQQARGLILVTGATGQGKSTTLASMIDYINTYYPKHIITIEDPVEIEHRNKRSLVMQREVGSDTDSFPNAMRAAMRQDPDVILIGEMRDRETVEAAIAAAQTGHLVFSTLHTNDTLRTINRVVEFFPPHEREQVRLLFSESLLGIMCQRLLPRIDKPGRVLALEVLVNTPLIRDYIKDEAKTSEIKGLLMEDQAYGMHTFDQNLVELCVAGVISYEEGLAAATSAHEYKIMMSQQKGRHT